MEKEIYYIRKTLWYRVTSLFILTAFAFNTAVPSCFAQMTLTPIGLPAAGTMIMPTPAFTPALIKGIKVHPENPLRFDFIVNSGDSDLTGSALIKESTKMIKYFLASLTVPENQMWVNLSPYEEDRIIPEIFGATEMGRDLLSQDYMLKQLTASMMYPEKELGKEFWQRVHERAEKEFNTTDIPIDTFDKIWIVPEKAVVLEKDNTAVVVESHLKVMLEEDYRALNVTKQESQLKESSETAPLTKLQTAVLKEIILPEVEKEVNTGKTFANLRQIYNAVILASWFKDNLKESLLGQIYVDKNKTKGVENDDKQISGKIYDQYIEAFKKGVYDYIKEDYDQTAQSVVLRKHFSGGITKFTSLSEGVREDVDAVTPRQIREMKKGAGKDFAMIVDLLEENQGTVRYAEAANAQAEEAAVADSSDAAMLAEGVFSWDEFVARTKRPLMFGGAGTGDFIEVKISDGKIYKGFFGFIKKDGGEEELVLSAKKIINGEIKEGYLLNSKKIDSIMVRRMSISAEEAKEALDSDVLGVLSEIVGDSQITVFGGEPIYAEDSIALLKDFVARYQTYSKDKITHFIIVSPPWGITQKDIDFFYKTGQFTEKFSESIRGVALPVRNVWRDFMVTLKENGVAIKIMKVHEPPGDEMKAIFDSDKHAKVIAYGYGTHRDYFYRTVVYLFSNIGINRSMKSVFMDEGRWKIESDRSTYLRKLLHAKGALSEMEDAIIHTGMETKMGLVPFSEFHNAVLLLEDVYDYYVLAGWTPVMQWAGNLDKQTVALDNKGMMDISFEISLYEVFRNLAPDKIAERMGLKGFVRFTTDGKNWSTPETDLPLEDISVLPERGEFGNYKIKARFKVPEGADAMEFNIRLVNKSSAEQWFDNNTVVNIKKADGTADAAMMAETRRKIEFFASQKVRDGGINLDRATLDLQIKRDGKGVALPVDKQQIESLKGIEGFVPVIINVTPIPSLPLILGYADEDENGRLEEDEQI
ncbi:MAG: hypothetical protein AB1650_07130 [Candidatus Omnitrophota bacterium]